MLHGGDYNPEQWRDTPEIWDEDMRLMKLARCNALSVGIFSWSALEPEEGRFTFDWLDTIMDKLAAHGAFAVLATPSGARPAWMSQKYPEVLRVESDRVRILHSRRHNHCFTSPVYREKVRIINRALAARYKDHPALLLWHISNEYGGECHCELCQSAFREWLRRRYGGDLDALNRAWWTAFWGHAFSDWSQIESPSPAKGESRFHGLNLDWKRFVTDQTIDFYLNEIAPLRELTPSTPITTNLMGFFNGLNYQRFARHLDVVSWDNYPQWHRPGPREAAFDRFPETYCVKPPDADWVTAAAVSFTHDMNRSLKGGQPFLLMESTPSMTNWMEASKLKRPGMHALSSLQAVAHGSDSVQYFQWRKSRGAAEKFHGAVVDHCGHENTRVFRDVAEVGAILEKLDAVVGSTVRPSVAILYDWENRWALEDAAGPRKERRDYLPVCQRHYRPFWKNGIAVDVIGPEDDLTPYRLVIAPMLYMVRDDLGRRIEAFVNEGGVFVTTYWSGIVNENDLCHLGGFPGPLRRVLGVWSEEIDALHDADRNAVVMAKNNPLGLKGEYEARILCDLIHAETAEVIATYKGDFYKGRPAVTVNSLGKGRAYYIASRNEDKFLDDFYGRLTKDLSVPRALEARLPRGVTAQTRSNGAERFVFVMNFTDRKKTIPFKMAARFTDLLTGRKARSPLQLPPYGLSILGGKD